MAYNIELTAGRYTAHAISAGAYETTGGALMVGVQWELDNAAHDNIISRSCLISKAGVIQEKRIAEIRKWAPGWDGVSMEWFGQHYTEFEVELTIERRIDSYDGKEKPEVAFIDPIGKGGNHSIIPTADQKALGAKFGARLRALAGTMPKPISTTPPAKVPDKAPTKSAGPDPVTEKRNAAWNAFKGSYTGADNSRNAAWFALMARAVPGKTNYEAFTAADWDAVIGEIEKAPPTDDGADEGMPF